VVRKKESDNTILGSHFLIVRELLPKDQGPPHRTRFKSSLQLKLNMKKPFCIGAMSTSPRKAHFLLTIFLKESRTGLAPKNLPTNVKSIDETEKSTKGSGIKI
jgi:hypothetical protein